MKGFYKVVKERQEYKGVRYFRFDGISEKVVQVTVNSGEQKKGRPAMFGVGLIARMSFLTNYLAMGYVEKCSKKEYETKFDFVVSMLK